MVKSNNKLVQIVGYLLLLFFILIIIMIFGMPNDSFSCGHDQSFLTINGQKIQPVEFYKYKRMMYGEDNSEQLQFRAIQTFVGQVLIQQCAEDEGITFSDDRISDLIKKTEIFINPLTGKYDPSRLQSFLIKTNLILPEFEKMYRRDQARNELLFYLYRGDSSPSEDVKFSTFIDRTRIQIRYAFLSNEEFKKRHAGEIAVSEAEIDSELTATNTKVSDPNTDRERIKKQLEEKKLDKIKNDIIEKINSVANSGGSFDSAAAILKGQIFKSAPFKIGEEVKSEGKDSKPAGSISNSNIFIDRVLVMNLNSASPVINSTSGLYIFTPVSRELPSSESDEETLKKTYTQLAATGVNTVFSNYLEDFRQKSKIIKNTKTD